MSKLNRPIQLSAVGAGFACPKTQSKLFSGERTSPLRTKRQHYPRFDTPRFKKNIINTLSSRSCRRFLILHLFLSAPIVTITLASAIYFICLCLFFYLFCLFFSKQHTGSGNKRMLFHHRYSGGSFGKIVY